jgi:hypothetical protein
MSNRTRQLPFVDRVLHAINARFAEKYKHNPSPKNMRAIGAIADTIEKMAARTAEDGTYLSWAAPGTGKTEAIIESIKQLLADARYRDCGIIVFLAHLNQVGRLVHDLLDNGIARDDISVLVGTKTENDELRILGRGRFKADGKWDSQVQKARVVIATQAKLHSIVAFRKRVHASTSLDDLWLYEGKPRRVRIWDETILPARTQVLREPDVCTVVDQLHEAGYTKQAEIINRWRLSLNTDEPTEVPVFDGGIDFSSEALGKPKWEFFANPTFHALLQLQWQGLAVHRDYDGNAVLHYEEVLPIDFTPLLVTDASGNLRCLMREWNKGRGRVIPLESGEKYYNGLTVHYWNHAGGKSAHRDKKERFDLVNAAASVFRHIPEDEEVLFIVRKPEKPHQNMEAWKEPWKGKTGSKGEMSPGIRNLLNPQQNARAHFLTWGFHTATNDYAHVKHVVLVGLLQTSVSTTAASLRAAGKMPPDETLSKGLIREAHVREAGHNLLQAAGRGSSRYLRGDQCPEGCTLWAIFSSAGQLDLPSEWLFKVCFPGARVEDWEPLGLQVRSNKLKTDNRVHLAESLVRRLGDAQTLSFELRDLEPEFNRSMSFRFLSKETVVRNYLRERYGVVLTHRLSEEKRRGSRWSIFSLERGG